MNPILSKIKDLLGIPADITDFDTQLVIHINSSFGTLHDLGVGPEEQFSISVNSGDWDDFMPGDETMQDEIILYIYNKVRLLFDPPSSSFVLTSLINIVKEQEWRLVNKKI